MLLRELFFEAVTKPGPEKDFINRVKAAYLRLYDEGRGPKATIINQQLAQEFGMHPKNMQGFLHNYYADRPGKRGYVKFSKEERDRALELFQQDYGPTAVAQQLNLEFHEGQPVRTKITLVSLKRFMVQKGELEATAQTLQQRRGIADTDLDVNDPRQYNWLDHFRRTKQDAQMHGIAFNITDQAAYQQMIKQGWASAASGQEFTAVGPDRPALRLLDPDLGYRLDNFDFVTQQESHQPELAQLSRLGIDIDHNALHLFFYDNFINQRANAHYEGTPFNITMAQAWHRINQQRWRCALTNRLFGRSGLRDANQPSLDQQHPRQAGGPGYTNRNCQYVTWQVNQSKKELTNEQYRRLCEQVVAWADRDPKQDQVMASQQVQPYRQGGRRVDLPGYHAQLPGHKSWLANYTKMVDRARDLWKQAPDTIIDRKDAWNIIQDQGWRCALTGQKMQKAGARSAAQASPDQIHPGQGYRMGNVQYVTHQVNRAKADMSNEEFIALCREVVAFRPKNR